MDMERIAQLREVGLSYNKIGQILAIEEGREVAYKPHTVWNAVQRQLNRKERFVIDTVLNKGQRMEMDRARALLLEGWAKADMNKIQQAETEMRRLLRAIKKEIKCPSRTRQ